MKKYEFSAKNVQEAINKGLKETNQKQEDVDIKILNEGGLFSKAKIAIITTEQDEEPVKEEVKEQQSNPAKPKKTKEAKAKKQEKQEKTPKVKADKKQKTASAKNENSGKKDSINFIKQLAEKMSGTVELSIKEQDENIFVDLKGDKVSNLIGYRGESLTAIQYLANVIEINSQDKKDRKRIILNIENYRQKREESLTALAKRVANKALKTGKSQRLEPMNAYDRRIVHSALTEENVNTYSKGTEPKRYLVIEPKK